MKTERDKAAEKRADLRNEDPLTGAPGAHPVGTGLGATGGGITGAAVGSVGGPIGAAVGAAVGAVVGGLVGKGAGEALNPTVENAYWEENWRKEGYVEPNATYQDYEPAYRQGYEAYGSQKYRNFNEGESDFARMWEERKGESRLGWEKAKHATRAAWDRVERAIPGDADRDGK
jgi:hypothetical protein